MPSPLSPGLSATSSQPGSNAGNYSGNSVCSSTTVSSNIPEITHSYVNIISYCLSALDNWERADALILKYKSKFLPSGFSVLCVVFMSMCMLQF